MSLPSVLVLGGIRSGKSEFAESLVVPGTGVVYVATLPPAGGGDDPEWSARVAAHRERRPAGWRTEEAGTDPGRVIAILAEAKPDQTVLVDDVGGWLTGVLADAGWSADAAREPAVALAGAVHDCAARVILVSPEVGLSVVPGTGSGRAFTDAMGMANRLLADVSDRVVLVVAGQPTWLKGRPVVRPLAPAAVPTEEPADGDEEPTFTGTMDLPLPDETAGTATKERLIGLGLGRLARAVSFAAGVQGTSSPEPFRAVRVLLLHGGHLGGVATGDDATDFADRVARARYGDGPLGRLAAQAGATIAIVDAGGTDPVRYAAPIEETDALGAAPVDAALRRGWRLAEAAADEGCDLIVLAATGVGQEAAAAAVVAADTTHEPAALLPRVYRPGGRIDDEAWMGRVAAVRDAMRRIRGRSRQARAVLAAVAGEDIAVGAGILLGAASRRTPVLIDGPVGVAAGLVARDLAGQVRHWTLLADHNNHPTVRAGAEVLGLEPVVDLGLGLGEGSTSLALLPLIQSALTLADDLSTVEQSTVEQSTVGGGG